MQPPEHNPNKRRGTTQARPDIRGDTLLVSTYAAFIHRRASGEGETFAIQGSTRKSGWFLVIHAFVF